MRAFLFSFRAVSSLFLPVFLAVVIPADQDASAQERKRINCYHCRDAQLLPCEDHGAAAEWCREHSFFCSECIKEFSCCRGRGLAPCKRCVGEDWSKVADDPGYGYFDARVRSQQALVEAMGADPMYAVTEHFLLISTMDGVKYSPSDVADMADEFNPLKKAFPGVFSNVHSLTPHAMLHLYALRLEKIYAKYCEAIGVTVEEDRSLSYSGGVTEVFLAGPVKHKNVWQSRHGGAALISGSSGCFVLAQKDTGGGGRNRRFYGPNMSGDRNFYDGVIHLTGRCLIDRFFSSGGGKLAPGWLKVGFPHYLEWEMLEQCSYYLVNIEISGLGQGWISQGWDKRIVAEARRSDCMTFPTLIRKDFADLGFREHLLSWGYVSFLVKKHPGETFRNYLDNLRRRVQPRDALMEAYAWSEMTLEDKWRRSLFGGGAAEDEELTKEDRFIAEFDRSRTHHDLETRASAAYYLKFCDNMEAANRMLQAFQEKELVVRASALEAFRMFENYDAIEYVVKEGLTPASHNVSTTTAVAMGTFPELAELSVPLLLKLLDDIKPLVRAGAVRGLGEIHPDEAYLLLSSMADDKSPEVRVETAFALWNYKRDDALTQLLKLLHDPVWAVRLASIRAMHNVRDKRTIPALIDQLGREGGRLREDIHELLVELTRQDFNLDAERWNSWWNKFGDLFEFKDNIKKRLALPKYAMQYHEVETCSKKFIFLLDVSSSMNEQVTVQKIGGKTYDKGDLRKPKVYVAKLEIARLLRTFDKNIFFNIITFSTEVDLWRKKVVSGTKGVTKAAEKYIWDITPPEKSATNIYDTLMTAFDMVDDGFAKRKYESVVDTMFLLSDGNPTAGPVTDVDMILRTVKERNRIHGIKIHTFSLGGRADTHFLRKLADITGGDYQAIKVR